MIVIPALKLEGSTCVVPETAAHAVPVPCSDHPVELVRGWREQGFSRFHVSVGSSVDSHDRAALRMCLTLADEGAMQWQAGATSPDDATDALEAGARWVVVCARLASEESWVAEFSRDNPGRVIIAADIRNRVLSSPTWTRRPVRRIVDLAEEWDDAELGGLLITCSDMDARVVSPDLPMLEDVVEAAACPVLVRAEVTSLVELRALVDRGVGGVVLGSTLYNGAVDPRILAEEYGTE